MGLHGFTVCATWNQIERTGRVLINIGLWKMSIAFKRRVFFSCMRITTTGQTIRRLQINTMCASFATSGDLSKPTSLENSQPASTIAPLAVGGGNVVTPSEEEQRQKIRDQLQRLKRNEQYEQRTDAWLKARCGLVTASDAGAILKKTYEVCSEYIRAFGKPYSFADGKGCNPYQTENEYILKKHGRARPFKGNVATQWGNRFEEVAKGIYERLTNSKVEEYGLHIHKNLRWLGASPDGITTDGVVLEIKCPYRRTINGVPPLHYWIQVQIQLEVLDLYDADYFEVEFVTYPSRQMYLLDVIEIGEAKGAYVKVNENKSICPPVEMDDPTEMADWAQDTIDNYEKEDDISIVYWKMVYYNIIPIKRNYKWFKTIQERLHTAHIDAQGIDVTSLPDYSDEKEEPRKMKRRCEEKPPITVDIC